MLKYLDDISCFEYAHIKETRWLATNVQVQVVDFIARSLFLMKHHPILIF